MPVSIVATVLASFLLASAEDPEPDPGVFGVMATIVMVGVPVLVVLLAVRARRKRRKRQAHEPMSAPKAQRKAQAPREVPATWPKPPPGPPPVVIVSADLENKPIIREPNASSSDAQRGYLLALIGRIPWSRGIADSVMVREQALPVGRHETPEAFCSRTTKGQASKLIDALTSLEDASQPPTPVTDPWTL